MEVFFFPRSTFTLWLWNKQSQIMTWSTWEGGNKEEQQMLIHANSLCIPASCLSALRPRLKYFTLKIDCHENVYICRLRHGYLTQTHDGRNRVQSFLSLTSTLHPSAVGMNNWLQMIFFFLEWTEISDSVLVWLETYVFLNLVKRNTSVADTSLMDGRWYRWCSGSL